MHACYFKKTFKDDTVDMIGVLCFIIYNFISLLSLSLSLALSSKLPIGILFIKSLKIYENRYKQKLSTNSYFGCYRYAVITTKFYILYVTQRIMFE